MVRVGGCPKNMVAGGGPKNMVWVGVLNMVSCALVP